MISSRSLPLAGGGSLPLHLLTAGATPPTPARSPAAAPPGAPASRSLVLTGALLALLAVAGCKGKAAAGPEPGAAPAASAAAPRALRFAAVETKRAARTLELAGTLNPNEQAELAAQVPGVVEKVMVDTGSRVKAGDVLLTLDGRDAALRLAMARALERQQRAALGFTATGNLDLDQTADVRAAREGRDLARREAARAEELLRTGVISLSAAETARLQAQAADAQYERARNGARQLSAGLAAARAQAGLSAREVGHLQIRAPFDGAVVSRPVSPGDYAPPGSVVVVVVDDDPLRLRAVVPETAVLGVKLGATVRLTVAALPGQVFTATVTRVGASLDPLSRTLPLEADLPNPDGVLKAGLFARASIDVPGSERDVLTVPRAAVGTSGSSFRVFVRREARPGEAVSRLEERLVTLGNPHGDRVEVQGNLTAGDQVAVEQLDTLADGDAVLGPASPPPAASPVAPTP